MIHPTIGPKIDPAKKDAGGGKPAVKKLNSQFHNKYTVSGFFMPVSAVKTYSESE